MPAETLGCQCGRLSTGASVGTNESVLTRKAVVEPPSSLPTAFNQRPSPPVFCRLELSKTSITWVHLQRPVARREGVRVMSTQHCRTERARTAVEPREERICAFQAEKRRSKKMQHWVTRLLALSSALMLAGSLHAGTSLKALGVSQPVDATNYYNFIDPPQPGHPQGLRGTQDQWKCVNGFPNVPGCATDNSGNTVVTVQGHKNKSDLGSDVNGPSGAPAYKDLGFYRRIDLVVDKRSGHQGNVAMTTYNYDLGMCCLVDNATSIVNMEYSPGPAGNRITKFYIYATAVTAASEGVNPGDRIGRTVFDPNSGTAEKLNLPKACAS